MVTAKPALRRNERDLGRVHDVNVRRRLATGLAVLVAVTAVVAGTASAVPVQTSSSSCDPAYGCTPAPPVGSTPTCSISSETATPGQSLTAHIDGVTPGTQVELTFDGAVVGSATAVAQQGSATGSADITFTVPEGTDESHTHTILFTGAGVSCDPTGGKGVAVLGETVTRSPGQSSGGGSLARTGLELGVLLAIAAALILAGREALRQGRRRRSRVTVHRP